MHALKHSSVEAESVWTQSAPVEADVEMTQPYLR